ncbi:hypothetical protein BV210_06165 [Halorientalis sp. IM1011]|uniref:DUF4382 domain-containing protein n=1 Tax=Halorientalis sp. IM1011 TaxID=1932360 RepID=UPI00097CC3C8|nr:DUF4382 domain-containing protein [Halorientalis sp. IM1011]AQL42320.1 hypothetical protein BV210_06165 [Halorientalis sp. IM1011]
MRTKALTALALAGMLVLAGCSGGIGNGTPSATDGEPNTADGTPTASGTSSVVITQAVQSGVNFYVSDEENAIGDFEHLNVTISEIGFQQAEGGWSEHTVDDRTVDLTQLQGANATRLTTVQPPNGTYTKVFAHVSDVNATLTSGEQVRVKLPSEKLQLNSEFTVGANTSTDFVFDIAVHKAGKSGKYILRPVVSQSGTDVPIESVDEELEVELEDDDDVTRGGNATLAVTRDDDPVANATVEIDGEQVGTTDADGRVTVDIPDEQKFKLVVKAGDDVADLRVTFEQEGDESEVEAEEGADEREDEDESERDDEREDDENETDADDDEREVNETESDDDDEVDDGDESVLNATFEGEVTPGENATISVTANGSAVANATVTVDDERIGTTDADGRFTVAVPADAEEFEVEIAAGEREAELEAEF